MKVLENNIDEPNMYCRAQATAAVLVETMDRYGVDKSVVCHVATKEKQHEDLLKFAKAINGDRLISFGSIMAMAPSWQAAAQAPQPLHLFSSIVMIFLFILIPPSCFWRDDTAVRREKLLFLQQKNFLYQIGWLTR